jgi:hypothetical protein
MKICQKPLPKATDIATTSKKVGIDHITDINHCKKVSTLPPKYPLIAPIPIPNKSEITTDTKPTAKDVLAPKAIFIPQKIEFNPVVPCLHQDLNHPILL